MEMKNDSIRSKLAVLVLFVTVCTFFSGSKAHNGVDHSSEELTRVQARLNASEEFSTLRGIFLDHSILGALNFTDGKNKTFLAPTNEAFSRLSEDELLDNNLIIPILAYHIVTSYLPESELDLSLSLQNNVTVVATQLGPNYVLAIQKMTSGITVNNVTFNSTDLLETGITSLKSIDTLLMPPESPNAADVEVPMVVEKLSTSGKFSTVLSYLRMPDVASAINLTDGNEKTIFAPTDAAFAALSPSLVAQLTSPVLAEVLSYHIHPRYLVLLQYVVPIITRGYMSVSTLLNEETLNATYVNGEIMVNGYYVNSTNPVLVTGRTAVYSLDGVLVPPSLMGAVMMSEQIDSAISSLNSTGYRTFVSVLYNADILKALNLSNGEPKTIFAPDNAAFRAANLSASQLDDTDFLVYLLSYHIVPAYLNATTVLSELNADNSTTVPTLLGTQDSLNVTRNNTGIYLNSIMIRGTDVVNNGQIVVHGISGVLVPPPAPPPPPPSPPPSPPLSSAVTASPPPPPSPSKATQISYIYALIFSIFAISLTSVFVL